MKNFDIQVKLVSNVGAFIKTIVNIPQKIFRGLLTFNFYILTIEFTIRFK